MAVIDGSGSGNNSFRFKLSRQAVGEGMRGFYSGNSSKVAFAVTSSARWSVWLDAHLVIDGVHDPLPGAEIPFRGLHRPMPEQELDLLKLSTG